MRSSLPHTETYLAPLASFGIVALSVFLGLGLPRLRTLDQPLPFNFKALAGHVACIALLCAESAAAAGGTQLAAPGWLFAGRLTLTLVAVVLLAIACIPARGWATCLRATGWLWLYALGAGTLAYALRAPLESLWTGAAGTPGGWLQRTTFSTVAAVLRPILPDLHVDPAGFILATPRFAIFIAQACSGLEGLGLVLVFTTVWLTYFRREFRFPQALLLVPCALLCAWTLNIARIAALMLIGNAGYDEIALVGFHSQAGWIAFTAVALGFSLATQQLAWVRRAPLASEAEQAATASESPATAAYLLPFLAILAASFVARAASGGFEWLYPLRFGAGAFVLWRFWPELKTINWRFGWLAPVTGAAVFLIWLAPETGHPPATASTLGDSLTALSPSARIAWLAVRVLAAVVTVPIAEELAFRGYLARRLAARAFDQVPYTAIGWLPILVSSVAFGLLHGRSWLVGILAGLAFAAVARWKGRLGDAIVAHAVSNLLLAAWVLARHDFTQW